MVGGRLLFWSVVGFFYSHWSMVGGFSDRWSMVPLIGGRLFLGKWSVVGVTVVGGWSVGDGFVLRLFGFHQMAYKLLFFGLGLTREIQNYL